MNIQRRLRWTVSIALALSVSLIATAQSAPEDTEVWDPEPAIVDPGGPGKAPSDAIVLFDGTDLSEWAGREGEAKWTVKDGIVTVAPGTGDITTKRSFGDIQLHIEWRTPSEVSGDGQGRGNGGVFLMDRYEVQILDSYNNRTYSNGQAGAIYKQHVPLVNASRGPGEWQSYDIVFAAPSFNDDGSVESPARVTVFHNGVLIQNNVEIKGPTSYNGKPHYEPHPDKQPIHLQDHGNNASFRNIWVREL